jgi:uncharacterized tellurite resistance protein B-like protein
MWQTILKTIGLDVADDDAEQDDALGHVARALGEMERAEARYVAAFAYLLSRAAHADHHLSDAEREEIERLIVERADLAPERARLVTEMVTAQSMRLRGTQDFPVSLEFARIATAAQKRALVDCMFAVSAADQSIITAEDNEIRRVASEIGLEHGDFVTIRGRYRDRLAVLHRPNAASDSDQTS